MEFVEPGDRFAQIAIFELIATQTVHDFGKYCKSSGAEQRVVYGASRDVHKRLAFGPRARRQTSIGPKPGKHTPSWRARLSRLRYALGRRPDVGYRPFDRIRRQRSKNALRREMPNNFNGFVFETNGPSDGDNCVAFGVNQRKFIRE